MKITIVIPTYNEASTIEPILEKVRKYGDEVLIVDSIKSKDRIEDKAHKWGVKVIKDHGKGKGEAIRCAINHLNEGIAVFMDADGSHIPEDIPKLTKPIQEEKADMVIASRFQGGSMELFDGSFRSMVRMFFTMCIAVVIRWRFHKKIADTQNGYRALRVEVGKKLGLKADKFDIETEEVMRCFKKGFRVMEVPSCELSREVGESRINLWKLWWTYVWRVLVNLF